MWDQDNLGCDLRRHISRGTSKSSRYPRRTINIEAIRRRGFRRLGIGYLPLYSAPTLVLMEKGKVALLRRAGDQPRVGSHHAAHVLACFAGSVCVSWVVFCCF